MRRAAASSLASAAAPRGCLKGSAPPRAEVVCGRVRKSTVLFTAGGPDDGRADERGDASLKACATAFVGLAESSGAKKTAKASSAAGTNSQKRRTAKNEYRDICPPHQYLVFSLQTR